MKIKLFITALIALSITAEIFSQGIGINSTGANAHGSAGLDVNFTNKGLLIPRVALTMTAAATPITAPATSLLVYNTATVSDVTPGFYYWNGTAWVRLQTDALVVPWNLTGNAGTINNTHFIGTTDNVPFNIRVSNQKAGRIESNAQNANTFYGYQSGNVNTGNNNVGIGYRALQFNTGGDNNTATGNRSLFLNTTGINNTASGFTSLYSNTTGNYNTASGTQALYSNTTGSGNTASGFNSLYSNTTGYSNTASGFNSLYSNTTGYQNTASGAQALFSNTIGNHNTADGVNTLYSNTTGDDNTANGSNALYSNTTGNFNTADGAEALYLNTGGDFNTASGFKSLYANTTGTGNTANGAYALRNNTVGYHNTAIGAYALDVNITGDNNSALGYSAGPNLGTLNNTTAVGYNATTTASNQVRIGNTTVSSIGGQVGWTTLSDASFKTNIQKNVPGLDFIKKLQPVTYIVDIEKQQDFLKTPDSLRSYSREQYNLNKPVIQTGFLAQDVEKAAKELGFEFSGVDAPKNENDYYGLRYAEFVVPLVKAMQEQQVQIENYKLKIEKQLLMIEELKKEANEIKNALKLQR
jgi:trimeric autotransporter adhesin